MGRTPLGTRPMGLVNLPPLAPRARGDRSPYASATALQPVTLAVTTGLVCADFSSGINWRGWRRPKALASYSVAVGEGFEPSRGVTPVRFIRPLLSTAQPTYLLASIAGRADMSTAL